VLGYTNAYALVNGVSPSTVFDWLGKRTQIVPILRGGHLANGVRERLDQAGQPQVVRRHVGQHRQQDSTTANHAIPSAESKSRRGSDRRPLSISQSATREPGRDRKAAIAVESLI
jgi:hypothetical protein